MPLLSGLSILKKISHMMDCYQKQQEEKYGCVFCPGLNFSSELTLLDHISIVHGGDGPLSGPLSGPMSEPGWSGPMSGPKNYECSLCGAAKKFNSKNILIQHMVKAHEGKLRKKQSCFRCGEIYGERSVIEKVKHIIGKRNN